MVSSRVAGARCLVAKLLARRGWIVTRVSLPCSPTEYPGLPAGKATGETSRLRDEGAHPGARSFSLTFFLVNDYIPVLTVRISGSLSFEHADIPAPRPQDHETLRAS